MVGIKPPRHKRFGGGLFFLFCPSFAFEKSIRKIKTMVQLQVAMCAIAKSRSQIKPKPNQT